VGLRGQTYFVGRFGQRELFQGIQFLFWLFYTSMQFFAVGLTAALEIRERLGHGRIEETRRALDQCR